MTHEAVFVETTSAPAVAAVGLSHLSIEMGHLYFEDFRKGPEYLRQRFSVAAMWTRAATACHPAVPATGTPRISTCYMVDDYFAALDPPHEVIPKILEAANAAGLTIDYLARESACAVYQGVEIASVVAGWIVDEPPEGANGVRPPLKETGWLSNGQRSPSGSRPAMKETQRPRWEPPRENARNNHSIFIDVELWSEVAGRRLWSCPMLASVWQLARLGLIRYGGRAMLQPELWTAPWPDDWAALPAVIRLSGRPKPFSAYRTLSLLEDRFLPVEHAVRTILSQISVEPAVIDQIRGRAQAEAIELFDSVLERISYVFSR